VARATIDRVSGSTSGGGEFFYDFRLLPGSFSGYFLLKARDIEFLKPVFRYLEDTGIGGERSIGLNRYKIELTEIDLAFLNGDSKKLVTLSQWGVNPAELDDAKANEFRYGLLPYRRKLETGFDLKNSGQLWGSKALYFAEGSVLVVKERRDFYGQLRDSTVVGSEKVVDYGICFPAFLTGGS
jgi:CRISPR-associated protein Csm4